MNERIQEKPQFSKASVLRNLLKHRRENPHCFILKRTIQVSLFPPCGGVTSTATPAALTPPLPAPGPSRKEGAAEREKLNVPGPRLNRHGVGTNPVDLINGSNKII